MEACSRALTVWPLCDAVTSQGPGTSLEFSLALVELLYSHELAEKLKSGMLVHVPQNTFVSHL